MGRHVLVHDFRLVGRHIAHLAGHPRVIRAPRRELRREAHSTGNTGQPVEPSILARKISRNRVGLHGEPQNSGRAVQTAQDIPLPHETRASLNSRGSVAAIIFAIRARLLFIVVGIRSIRAEQDGDPAGLF